jgi:hypothetical protein
MGKRKGVLKRRNVHYFALTVISLCFVFTLLKGELWETILPDTKSGLEPVAPTGSNYVMVNSIVASGQVSSPMASTNYQMRGVLGEPGLPNNETNLLSQNFQHQPGFLAAEPSSSMNPPNYAINLPTIINLPLVIFPGPCEDEDNDSAAQANGPLGSGQVYCGEPDDTRDYFYIYPLSAGTIVVDLTNHTGEGVQLQLFYQTTQNLVAFDSTGPTYHVEYTGPAGLYYIYIFTASGYNNTEYSLVANYPD